MARPSANVTVVTEVGYCPFCQRTRNLRREERHLGALVRTSINCESCNRTLSSTMGPAPHPEPVPEHKVEPAAELAAEPPSEMAEAQAPAPAAAAPPAKRAARPPAASAKAPADSKPRQATTPRATKAAPKSK